MTFVERIQHRVQGKEELPFLRKWIASGPSSHPATETKDWIPKIRTAQEAKMALFLGLYLHEWETWELVRRISEKAYFQRYQGSWIQVLEILRQEIKLSNIEEKYSLFAFTEDEFFGNFLPQCNKFLKKNPKALKSSERKLRKPKNLVYRRGYKDKGLQRPFDKRGRNLPDPEPGEDHRNEVRYAHYPDL